MLPASVSLSRSFTRLRYANTAEWIEFLFGVEILGDIVGPIRWGSHNFCHKFDTAFAKLLWPFIIIIIIIIINEYYYGGAVAILLQDHLTMSLSRFAD